MVSKTSLISPVPGTRLKDRAGRDYLVTQIRGDGSIVVKETISGGISKRNPDGSFPKDPASDLSLVLDGRPLKNYAGQSTPNSTFNVPGVPNSGAPITGSFEHGGKTIHITINLGVS